MVWRGVEILAPTGIRSADFPARTESLYQRHYSGLSDFSYPWENLYKKNLVVDTTVVIEGVSVLRRAVGNFCSFFFFTRIFIRQ